MVQGPLRWLGRWWGLPSEARPRFPIQKGNSFFAKSNVLGILRRNRFPSPPLPGAETDRTEAHHRPRPLRAALPSVVWEGGRDMDSTVGHEHLAHLRARRGSPFSRVRASRVPTVAVGSCLCRAERAPERERSATSRAGEFEVEPTRRRAPRSRSSSPRSRRGRGPRSFPWVVRLETTPIAPRERHHVPHPSIQS